MKYEFDRDKFRVRLLATGQTQSEFGFKIGKSPAAISAYILGRVKPSVKCVASMAEALHCKIEDLLEDWAEVNPFESAKPTYTEDQKEAMAFESLMTAIELIKIARDMLGEFRKGAQCDEQKEV